MDSEKEVPVKQDVLINAESHGSDSDVEKPSTESHNVPAIDPVKEKALLKKVDRHIIPVVMILYFMSFIDRVNIGNARLYDMESDLNMSGNQFQIAVSLLFPTYVLGELPSNWIIKHYVRPSRWLAFITVAWGLIATFTGLVQSYSGLLACRVLLGFFEAGLFPGCAVFLTTFYTKRELGLRMAFFFSSSALAGAFGGLLAYAIGFMHGVAGYSGWRWILIIEGIPTILCGIAGWWVIADSPETAYFLNEEERKLLVARRDAQLGQMDVFDWKDARKGLKDWKVYTFACLQFCNVTMLYSFSTFLPTIISEIMPEAGRAVTQLLTIPCYSLGAASYMLVAWFSDRKQTRGPVAMTMSCFAIIGYAILLSPLPSGVLYMGTFWIALGAYAAIGIPASWHPINIPRYGKRTTAIGVHIMLGNVSGVSAPFLYPTSDAPRFIAGHAASMSLVLLGFCCFGVLTSWYRWENRQRALGKRDHLLEGKTEEEILAMGDDNPRYRFSP